MHSCKAMDESERRRDHAPEESAQPQLWEDGSSAGHRGRWLQTTARMSYRNLTAAAAGMASLDPRVPRLTVRVPSADWATQRSASLKRLTGPSKRPLVALLDRPHSSSLSTLHTHQTTRYLITVAASQ
ncbi:hypothetical protein SVAN01_02698 [Stagonosporopsis vannaccii]|nr:hypothetical protein SVAN01_02698 [Stagonosporopsis vannaccii]